MRILVTGATGFIGRHLVRCLVERGESVRILCRPTADVSSCRGNDIEICWGDILDPPSIEVAMRGCDRVYHLAAYARAWAKEPGFFFTLNVHGMRNVLAAALKGSVEKVVYTSSAVTLGPSNGLLIDESSLRSAEFLTTYEHSKFVAEKEVQRFVQDGLNTVIVNPTRVFGPGLLNESNSATRAIQWYLQGKLRVILGDGRGVGNYAFVHDVVKGHLLAMERGRTGQKYLLGGENASYDELFEIISEVSQRRYRVFHLPRRLALLTSSVEELRAKYSGHYPLITPGWVRTLIANWAFSIEKARKELGYTITPLREAIETTVDWLEQQNGRGER